MQVVGRSGNPCDRLMILVMLSNDVSHQGTTAEHSVGRKAGITREDVLHAAVAIADGEGLEAVTLAAVATRLGVRSPSLYAHVAGLEDVQRELTLHGAARLGLALDGATRGAEGMAALRALAAAYRYFARQHPGFYQAAQQAQRAQHDPEVASALEAAVRPALRALESAGVSGAERIHMARAIRSALHGFVVLEGAGGFGLPASVNESYEKLVALLLAGVAVRATQPDG
jgi:AcrR family transcriptional regulator